MTDAIPSDYDSRDGIGDGAIDICAHCERSLHPHDYSGTVYDTDGREYDHITDTDPNNRPFFCGDCWEELERNRNQQENATLGEWSQ